MGIHFQLHSMTMPGWMSRPYEPESGEYEEDKAQLEEELEAGAIKVNDLMRDEVASQLNTIMAEDNREFTREMLGRPGDGGKGILDIRA